MPVPELTVDELIATINRSSLPVVAVEGETDAEIMRHLEKWIGIDGSIVRCGGRNNIFDLVDREHEITNRRVVFLADQDFFCIKKGRRKHPYLVYTWGFSIENDILAGSQVDNLIRPEEIEVFVKLQWLVARYFAFEYELSVSEGRNPTWNVSLQEIIDVERVEYRRFVSNGETILAYRSPFCNRLYRNIKKLLRGKQLVQLYLLILNRPKRSARFSKMALLDSCACMGRNSRLSALARQIRSRLSKARAAPS